MPETKQLRVPELTAMKSRGEPISMLTAYDATMARLMDQAGIDVLLVGDSLGMVILGGDDTLEVTMDDMIRHTRAVRRGAQRAMVVADMPFMSYQASVADAVRNAGRLMQEGGAVAVKLEGGRPVIEAVERMVSVGIPVMGHLGLLPQSVRQLGGFKRQASTKEAADLLMQDAEALEYAGACALVLECIPDELAREVSRRLHIPTIGIGSGPDCDGQVLVSYDLLGLTAKTPPFAKKYAHLNTVVTDAARAFIKDVKATAALKTRNDG
ncbi:MAG: 3-methyl-2-oxobutanoate hydroxymethyltransferase [Acidobacteriota bacterium]